MGQLLDELTPDGLKLEKDVDRSGSPVRHSSKRFDRAIIFVLTIALAYFAVEGSNWWAIRVSNQ